MISFICPKCGAVVIDSPQGYLKGCEHYRVIPTEKKQASLCEDCIKRVECEAFGVVVCPEYESEGPK